MSTYLNSVFTKTLPTWNQETAPRLITAVFHALDARPVPLDTSDTGVQWHWCPVVRGGLLSPVYTADTDKQDRTHFSCTLLDISYLFIWK